MSQLCNRLIAMYISYSMATWQCCQPARHQDSAKLFKGLCPIVLQVIYNANCRTPGMADSNRLILSVNDSVFPSLCLITSLLDILSILLNQAISATSIFFSSVFRRHRHSDPYSSTGITSVSYSLIFVLLDILLALHIFNFILFAHV